MGAVAPELNLSVPNGSDNGNEALYHETRFLHHT